MLMGNHMTLQLPLSSSIFNPIDMDQVWKWLPRQLRRNLIPVHEKRLFFYFLSFQGIPEALDIKVTSVRRDELGKGELNV